MLEHASVLELPTINRLLSDVTCNNGNNTPDTYYSREEAGPPIAVVRQDTTLTC